MTLTPWATSLINGPVPFCQDWIIAGIRHNTVLLGSWWNSYGLIQLKNIWAARIDEDWGCIMDTGCFFPLRSIISGDTGCGKPGILRAVANVWLTLESLSRESHTSHTGHTSKWYPGQPWSLSLLSTQRAVNCQRRTCSSPAHTHNYLSALLCWFRHISDLDSDVQQNVCK